ncbi:MAG: glycosyl transferase [Candidatus Parcubacteria bacterium]|nr:MAG: glycosyl transferase [Candidatus Parcubacteria bacterium]
MNKPLVSVIIPTYNRANLLPKAINSVINQTYKNWELLIIDDGSKDNTKKIVEEFIKKDSRIKYFYQENSGQPAAMNLGIKNSNGEYVAFLDDDDEWSPEKLEKQLKEFEKDKNIALVYTDALIVGGELNNKKSSDISKLYFGYVYKNLLYKNFITASSVMIKRKIFNELGLFDENYLIKKTQTQDYDMWLRIAKYYKFGYVPEILVKYNYVQKITNWQKRKRAYVALIYIYSKNIPFAVKNIPSFFILIRKIFEYILKYLIATFLGLLTFKRR